MRAVPFSPTSVVSTIVGTPGFEPTVRLFAFGDVDGPPLNARLQHCMDVAYGDGQIYVADTYNHKIKAIDVKTRQCRTVAGNGKPGRENGAANQTAEFFEPEGISCAGGKLFVADTNNHCIRIVDLPRGEVSTLPISGLSP